MGKSYFHIKIRSKFLYFIGYSWTRTISSTWVLNFLLMINYIRFIFSPLYYREANGAILVFDITDEDSFNQVYKILIFKTKIPFVYFRLNVG